MSMTAAPADAGNAVAKPGTRQLLLNFIAFQIGWFACVWGAAHDMAVAGTVVAALVVALHLFCAARPGEELKLVAAAILIGALLDSAVLATGVLQFHTGAFIAGVAPHWILALWALFATTLNVSLSWLRGRWLLAAVLGAIAGPLSYWGGAKLGAVVLVQPLPAVVAMAIEWAIAMPLLMRLAQRFDGVRPPIANGETARV